MKPLARRIKCGTPEARKTCSVFAALRAKKRNRFGHLSAEHRELDDAADRGALRGRDQRPLPIHLVGQRR
jgi:hypothetical protein